MKLSNRLIKQAEQLEAKKDAGGKLNRHELRVLAAVTKKADKA